MRFITKQLIVFLVLFSTITVSVHAQQFLIDEYGSRQGLASAEIYTLFQDQTGYLWMGTRLGVSRFDGLKFTNYSGAAGVRFGKVFSMAEDDDQYIWIGAEHGLFYYHAGIIKHIQLDRFPDNWIYSVHTRDGKSLWIGTANGPVFINSDELAGIKSGQKITYILFKNWNQFSTPDNQVLTIEHDDFGAMYFGTRASVVKYDNDTYSLVWQSKEASLEDVSGICKGLNQDVYIATRNGYFYNAFENMCDTVHAFTFSGGIAQIGDRNYYVLAVDKLFEWNDGTPKQVYDFSLKGYDYLSCLLIDREKNIWVGTWEGLVKLRKNIFATFLPGETENLNDIFSVVPQEFGPPVFGGNKGNVIIPVDTSRYGSLGIQDLSNIKFEKYLPDGMKPWDLSEVFGIYFSGETVWFGSGYQGISAWVHQYGQPGKLFHFDEKQLSDMHGHGFFHDYKKNFYCLSEGGLTQIFYEDGPAHATFKYYPWPVDIGGQYLKIFDQVVLPNNEIYLATNFGLVYFNGDTLLDVQVNDENLNEAIITSIVLVSKTSVWVATGNYGIYLVELKKTSANVLLQINQSNGLLSDAVLDMLYDGRRLWCAHYNGLTLIHKLDDQFKVVKQIDEGDGFLPRDFTYIKMADTGPIWLATTSGVQVFSPDDVPVNQIEATPVIIDVLLFNGAIDIWQYATGASIKSNLAFQPVLPYNKNSLTFQFQSVSLTIAEKNKCRYKLMGYDTAWAYANGFDEVTFAALAPGDYIFTLQAANNDGRWSTMFDTYAFTIKKPFWATGWFIVTAIFAIIFISYSIYKYRINQLIKINSIRNKIAGDLHDDIGSTLSSISMYSEIINSQLKEKAPESTNLLNKISENSKEMISNMSDIVWAIKPSNDTFKNIESRMFNFASELCNAKGIALKMEPNNELEHLKIPMEQRRDLYLIFKEAVNNAVKYADCSVLTIVFSKLGTIQMHINDNGKGFDLQSKSAGNGLENMKRRAISHHWDLEIQAVVGEGTKVVLKM